jgi:5-methylthioadenosine/S-adenosylhomocysteine deaminase
LVDLIINAGILVTVDANNSVLYNKSVVVKDGTIIDILDTAECKQKYNLDALHSGSLKIISAENQIVMPGFINTHTHIPMSYFKGLADDLPLDKWLNEYIWPAETRCINREFIYDASLHGIAELIRNGITCFNDMYFIPQETVNACRESGMRAVLGDVVIGFPMGDFHKAENNLKHLLDNIDSVADTDLIDFSIAAHSVYACSEASWKMSIKAALDNGLMIHTHLCETEKEVADCKKQYGKSPVKFLYDLGAFDTKLIFAHGVHLHKDDFALIKGKDCSVAVNLHSNMKLASGILPMEEYLSHEVNVSFGTDGVASNNTLSISDEINTASKLFKVIYKDPSYLPAQELVKMATINGARALGKDNITGSIEVHKSADIVCIDIDNAQCQPVYDPFSYIVHSMNRQRIRHVIINGRIVLNNGETTTIDSARLMDNVKKYKKIVRNEL